MCFCEITLGCIILPHAIQGYIVFQWGVNMEHVIAIMVVHVLKISIDVTVCVILHVIPGYIVKLVSPLTPSTGRLNFFWSFFEIP